MTSLLSSPSRRAAAAQPDASAAAAEPAQRTLALEARLQQTNARIVQLLDQMSWREEDASRSRGALSTEMDGEAAEAPPLPVAAAAVAASSASPASAASLLSTCRPFDRTAFLARVSTFSPLVWMHRAQTGTALSPLLLARLGWIAAPPTADGRIAIDTVVCPLCAVEVTLHFSPEVLALSDPAPIRALARKYATQVLPSAHASNCAWNLAQADVDFTRIVPGGVSQTGEVSANRRAVVLGQAEQRALTLSTRASLEFWRSFTVASSFVEAASELLKARSIPIPVSPTIDPMANMDLTMLLALCGWEIRAPLAAAAASSTAESAVPAAPMVLQCCFGCREVGALERFCSEANEAELAASSAGQSGEDDTAAEEYEERSALQSPIKRRRTDTSSKVMSRSSSAVGPARPVVRIRASVNGFHPAREHRPFCPFVQPIVGEPEEGAAASVAAGSSSASASSSSSGGPHAPPSSPASAPAADSSCLVGWEQVLLWFHQRIQSKAAMAEKMQQGEDESEAALADFGSAAASSSLPHKERQFQSAITTVRKLLQAHAR